MSADIPNQISSIELVCGKGNVMKRERSVLKTINVSEANYYGLKRCGLAGDSFNDVIEKLLAERMQRLK